jgi:hypothetical protein
MNSHPNSLLLAGLLAMTLQFSACSTAQVTALRSHPPSIERDEGIAIVVSHEARDLEVKAVRCIRDAVTNAYPSLRIVSPDEFRHAAFSDLPPEGAPYSAEYLTPLLNDLRFRERIAPLKLRYLFCVSGVTEQGVVGAAAGAGAGLVVWNRSTGLTASVLDLKQLDRAEEIKAAQSGNPWVLIIAGVPLGVPSRTESQACDDLGQAVTKFLGGQREEPASAPEGQPR